MHARDGRMIVQQARDPRRVLAMHAQPRVQCAYAAQRQVAVEGRAGDADAVGPPDELLVQFRASLQSTAPPTTSL